MTSKTAEKPVAKPERESRVNPIVFFTSAGIIIALTLWAWLAPGSAETVIGAVVEWVATYFGWYYFLTAAVIIGFILFIGISRYGKVKLGPEQSKPQFNIFTWAAMLFAAGIGTDLMFFSVSEPVTQYLAPPDGDGKSIEAARQAVVWTLFHYGITGWAMYALMGMALAYFAYRRNLPLSIRAALYPIFGKRIWGPIGHSVDIAAVLGTIFGIATSLGIGVVQLNFGLKFLFDLPQNVGMQAALIGLAVVIATISTVSGVDKGIRRLSEINVVLALMLTMFILFTGKTTFLLNSFVMNVGDYLTGFVHMTMNTFAFDHPDAWLNSWTLFFWAWWIAWAPFVGLFLARISRGRSIRQFVAGTMIIPFIYILLWVCIFGNSALDIVMNSGASGAHFGQVAMNHPEKAFYSLLADYPWAPASAGVATFTGLLFYVTSADSGALVMSNFTSYLKTSRADGAKWLRVFWAVATGLLTLVMLSIGGITTLQNATIIMGLPFSFVLYLIMLGLYKSLKGEGRHYDSVRAALPGTLSSRTSPAKPDAKLWRRRLTRMMSYPGKKQTERFMLETCKPAVEEVLAEFRDQSTDAAPINGTDPESGLSFTGLSVNMGDAEAFTYTYWPVECPIPEFATGSARGDDVYYRIEVYIPEGTQGYNVQGYSKEQLISDILDYYERHLTYLRITSEDSIVADPPETDTADVVAES
ncbi:choline BCCT transporter BetT [Spelaeicoccus albus]|uniref:Choline/glycine/proline betaine transport protein n=1 Tax=Spelaeicoccus albus TaxID=1280376 RepID=A0A7Z0D224_9MICO|nr:choline BCCT transporter BetT [Spelaeicoccus albus]NYI67439.1 choline/glycine/proline betaine transport protein [Spelaeicoccus albus]